MLLANGADPNVRDIMGNTLLHKAAYNLDADEEMFWLLLKVPEVRKMVNNRMGASFVGKDGVLTTASGTGGKEGTHTMPMSMRVRATTKKVAVTGAARVMFSCARLHHRMSSSGCSNRYGGLIQMLAQMKGATALHYSLCEGNLDLARLLIQEGGADTTIKNALGQTAAIAAGASLGELPRAVEELQF